MPILTPELLLRAYANGVFPMAESAVSEELMWFDPPHRGVLPLDRFHVPRRLRKTVRHFPYDVRIDSDFHQTMERCAAATPARPSTWINSEIVDAYCRLYELGFAHSVECWTDTGPDGAMVGGLYGVSLGGAFFGESMFSTATDASKVALVHLVARLVRNGFSLLDTQFITSHLAQFGAVEIPRHRYRAQLAKAVNQDPDFQGGVADERGLVTAFLQSLTQIS